MEVCHFIKAICFAANDNETADRLQVIEDTAKKRAEGKNTFGFPKLEELTDRKIGKSICQWLEIEFQNVSSNKSFEGEQLSNSLSATLFDGTLILEVTAEGKKHKIIAKDKNEIFAFDVFNLSESTKRANFVESLKEKFDENEQKEILREPLQLVDEAANLPKIKEQTREIVRTSFKVLKDGRIIEQIRPGFAVYKPETDSFSIKESVEDSDGTIYQPIDDELLQRDGGIYLADELEEYESEIDLLAEIESYVFRYIDLKPLQLKLTAIYILFTYVFDKFFELSYLNPIGDAGSGKSRFGFAACIASRRGLIAVNPSAASLFRIVDKYQPTLFIDEANFDIKSDDTSAIIQILNTGFQKIAKIPRQILTGDGNYQTQMFDAFCPKIIGALKKSASQAFNSRCIEIQMERTKRNDIPLRLSQKMLNDARHLRNKLTFWRLRNYNQDFEAKLDQAEIELRAKKLIPRSIQINIPLYALIENKHLKNDFVELLKGHDEILNEEKQSSFEGEIVQTLHTILFNVSEDNKVELQIERPSENNTCEDLRIEKIVSMMNATRKEKDQLNEKTVGKKIRELGLRSKQLLSRKSDFRKKTAIIFDSHKLRVIFENYGLQVPDKFSLDQSDHALKLTENNNLERSKGITLPNQNTISLDHPNSNNNNNNGK